MRWIRYVPMKVLYPNHYGNTGGIYSSSTGLALDSLTGVISPEGSTPGTYEITYTPELNGQLGQDINGTSSNYRLSYSNSGSHAIAMNAAGDKMVVGAMYQNRVLVYAWDGSNWDLEQNIGGGYSYFGCSVDMNAAGDRIVVGAYNSSRALTYSWNGSTWIQEANLNGSTLCGWDVSMSNGGDTIAISEPYTVTTGVM